MVRKFLSVPERASYRSLEDVVGCKWSAAVVGAISRGVNRPGELQRFIPGISKKVLSERLRKLLDYRLIERTVYEGLPPRVDYTLTPTGRKLGHIIEQLHDLDATHVEKASDRTVTGSAAGAPKR